jgi:Proteins of 100 residues with WXG
MTYEEKLMAIWGADVEQLRTLGTKLQAGASTIEQERSNLTRLLDSTVWKGPDADHFRGEWSGAHTSALNQVIQALKDAGQKATRNANEQDQASR